MSEQVQNRLGVDIGGTYIKLIVLQGDRILHRSRIKTAKTSEGVVACIAEEYRRLKQTYPIAAAGVGVPGVIQDGLVLAENLSFWQVPLERMLREQLDCPVEIENDANCAALGEVQFGNARDSRNVIMITLGTGIGGGIILNRQIYRGTGAAGEIGHMIIQAEQGKDCPCGLRGCWEQYASAAALIRQAEAAAVSCEGSMLREAMIQNGGKLDGERFFQVLKNGCPTAKEVFERYIYYLAVGLESVANILAPEVIILAGGITEEKDLILEGLKAALRMDICVRVSTLKNDAGAMGAAMLL